MVEGDWGLPREIEKEMQEVSQSQPSIETVAAKVEVKRA